MVEKEGSPEEHEVSEEAVIDALRHLGGENSDAKELLLKWTLQAERHEGTPEAFIEFNRKKSRLYAAAGILDEAWESLEAAYTQAWNEGREMLCQDIENEIDALEGSSKRKTTRQPMG